MGVKVSKDDIIKALLEEAFMRSAGETSLKDIADKIGIKKASLYNHFESREDIVKQTFASCAEYISAITFTPKDIDAVTKKYPAQVVFKGIVNRYFKMHEKPPLFQIYTFVESQKYFSSDAAQIIEKQDAKIFADTQTVMKSLIAFGKLKLPEENIQTASRWFCAGIKNMLENYLQDRKQLVVNSPASGEGELFSLPAEGKGLDKVDAFIDAFIMMIQ